MNYRNKTVYDWKTFSFNIFSSLISLQFMKLAKEKIIDFPIRNVIIRDIENQIGIIFQIEKTEFSKEEGDEYYQYVGRVRSGGYQIPNLP